MKDQVIENDQDNKKKRKSYPCQKCHRVYTASSGLLHHMARVHDQLVNYRCETCGQGFFTERHYVGHQSKHLMQTLSFKCKYCGRSYMYDRTLKAHEAVCSKNVENVNSDNHDSLNKLKGISSVATKL